MKQIDNNEKNVYIAVDRNVPVIVGNCPTCNTGSRSLILIDYNKKSKYNNDLLHIKCACCFNSFKTTLDTVTR